MPELSPDVQAFIVGAVVWLVIWVLRKLNWAGDLKAVKGLVTSIVVAGLAAIVIQAQAAPVELLALLRGWFIIWATSQGTHNTAKRVI